MTEEKTYTMYGGEYRIWPCGVSAPHKYRWALREWPDDGTIVETHGGAQSLRHVVREIENNRRLRHAVTAWDQKLESLCSAKGGS